MFNKVIKILNSPISSVDKNRILPKTGWLHFVIALLITLIITLICLLFKERIEPVNLSMFYLLGVVFASVYLGFLPAIVTSVTSVLIFDFVFVPPYWSFTVHESEYLISFLVFILIATVISQLAASSRQKLLMYIESSKKNEELSEIMHKSNLVAEKEALRNSLLSSIAHDIRTPATTISGYASVLCKNLSEANLDNCEMIAKNLYSESLSLIGLIENILNITKIQSGINLNREMVPVDEIIISAVRRTKRKLENYILSMKLDNRIIQINGDPHLLEQMIINLLENSVKYSPEQSMIEIKTSIVNQSVVISVKDEGLGIPAGEEQNIFEKFYRLKRDKDKQGTGLGLALCKAVSTLHDGNIEAKRGTVSGTKIIITLPAVIIDDNNAEMDCDER